MAAHLTADCSTGQVSSAATTPIEDAEQAGHAARHLAAQAAAREHFKHLLADVEAGCPGVRALAEMLGVLHPGITE